MKTSITKSFYFEAAHQLNGHIGKCSRLHGHSYTLEVTVSAPVKAGGSSDGMVLDFTELSKIVDKEIIEKWDHGFLNDIVPFRPTAELLALDIFNRLTKVGLPITRICLWETKKSCAVIEL